MARPSGTSPTTAPISRLSTTSGSGSTWMPVLRESSIPARRADGLVVEIGCGSGLLTRHLLDAGHRVVATDASDAMLELARHHLRRAGHPAAAPPRRGGARRRCHRVGGPRPELPGRRGCSGAGSCGAGRQLRPDGVLAIDLCDLAWGRARLHSPPQVRRSDEWLLVTEFPPRRRTASVRHMTTFIADGSWRHDDERHDNVLVDTALVPTVL